MDEREKLKRAAEDAVFQISKLSSRFSGDTPSSSIKTSDEEDMEDMLAPPSFQVYHPHPVTHVKGTRRLILVRHSGGERVARF